MRKQLRHYAVGALVAGTIAGGAALALPGAQPAWRPVTFGLDRAPARLLPAAVSSAHPVRVAGTVLDHGRPVTTVHTATDRAGALALVKQAQKARNALGVRVDARIHALEAPAGSDPLRTRQWDLAKLDVADAWTRSTGAGAVVAVIDTGVDASHPDLAGQVLTGFDELTQQPGGDTDQNGHGTHVAGTIAAVTGNGIGISGIAPDARIMPIRVLNADGSGYLSDASNGIVYAADHGANVINMSLGTDDPAASVADAVGYARSKGVVVVAAAGNERQQGSPVSYPAADPGVIGVAATGSDDVVAGYSNRGSYVDIAAPGSAIISTFPAALNGTGYQSMYGTSMASPHVAAVVALLEAYHPGLTPDQVENALESTAVDLGTPGRDDDYGYGRVDPTAALAAVASLPDAPTSPAVPTGPDASASPDASTSPGAGPADSPAAEPTSADPTSAEPTSADPASAEPSAGATGADPGASPTGGDPSADPTGDAP